MRRLTRSQEGVALPAASAMLLVISLFVIAFFSVTLQVSETAIEDRSSKRALAAAEAGLETALYRMNQIGTSQSTACFTVDWVPPGEDGQCPATTGPLGNGASYAYYVTPELGTGLCVVPGMPTDRCITAIGMSDGVQRRVQVRANTITGAVSYKTLGLMSKSLMYAGNSSEITSDLGANGVVHFGNSAKTFSNPSADIEGAIFPAPGSTYQVSGSGQEIAANPDLQPVPTPYQFPPIDFEAVETTAVNIVSGLSRPGMTYNAATKQLRVTGSSASLPAGTYYFCRFSMANGAKLSFSTSEPTKIYVDSPSRSGAEACQGQSNPATTYPVGTFWLENSNEFNKDGREDLVEVLVHGTTYNGTRSGPSFCTPAGDLPHTDKCESDVLLNNSAGFEGMIYAPDTTVELNNSGKMKGAIAADKIRFNNSVVFELTAAVKDSAPVTNGGIDRGNWIECRPEPTVAADPESGC